MEDNDPQDMIDAFIAETGITLDAVVVIDGGAAMLHSVMFMEIRGEPLIDIAYELTQQSTDGLPTVPAQFRGMCVRTRKSRGYAAQDTPLATV